MWLSPPVSVDSEVKISMQGGTAGTTSVEGGRRVVQVSSNANNELNASDFLLNSNNATSNANVNITSGTLSRDNNARRPYPHGKTHYYTPLCVGREIENSGVTRE